MGTTEITFDDVDQTVTQGVQTVQVGLDGRDVLVDLGESNRTKLAEFLAPFLAAGRGVPAKVEVAEKVAREPRAARPARKATVKTAVKSAVKSEKTAPKITSERAAAAAENERIRAWAEEQKIELNPRGRIPNEVKEQYRQANPLHLVS